MEKLKLPIIKEDKSSPKCLSMDDYLQFVYFHLKYTFDKKSYWKWKKMLAVNEPFSL